MVAYPNPLDKSFQNQLSLFVGPNKAGEGPYLRRLTFQNQCFGRRVNQDRTELTIKEQPSASSVKIVNQNAIQYFNSKV